VGDFNGDESVCFDTDLEVLILRRMQMASDWYWALAEK
jgi:hypothetical protein